MKVECCNCKHRLCSVCNPLGCHPTVQEIATALQVVSATTCQHSHVSHATVRLVGGSAEVCACGMVALTPRDGCTGEWVTVAEACRRMTTGQWLLPVLSPTRSVSDDVAKVEKKVTVVHAVGKRRNGLFPPLCGSKGMWSWTGVVDVYGHMCSLDITMVNCKDCQTAFIKLPDGEQAR